MKHTGAHRAVKQSGLLFPNEQSLVPSGPGIKYPSGIRRGICVEAGRRGKWNQIDGNESWRTINTDSMKLHVLLVPVVYTYMQELLFNNK
jgi:hypothetical protein